GDDRLYGLEGNDVLFGGPGRDVFVFNTKPSLVSNLDRIVDFSVRDDTIYLDNAVFTKLAVGKLPSAAFWTGAKAHDSTDRVVYDSAKGDLYYDGDGTGTGAPVQIAKLSTGLRMTADDFQIV
ncbi:MAG TPA: calcium-binding protein, partial [Microvirga sp.]|nr:calcium-binding protein [Microvirga sp.]